MWRLFLLVKNNKIIEDFHQIRSSPRAMVAGTLGPLFIRQARRLCVSWRPTGLLAMPLFSSEFEMQTFVLKAGSSFLICKQLCTRHASYFDQQLQTREILICTSIKHGRKHCFHCIALHCIACSTICTATADRGTEQSWFVHMQTPALQLSKHRPNQPIVSFLEGRWIPSPERLLRLLRLGHRPPLMLRLVHQPLLMLRWRLQRWQHLQPMQPNTSLAPQTETDEEALVPFHAIIQSKLQMHMVHWASFLFHQA